MIIPLESQGFQDVLSEELIASPLSQKFLKKKSKKFSQKTLKTTKLEVWTRNKLIGHEFRKVCGSPSDGKFNALSNGIIFFKVTWTIKEVMVILVRQGRTHEKNLNVKKLEKTRGCKEIAKRHFLLQISCRIDP